MKKKTLKIISKVVGLSNLIIGFALVLLLFFTNTNLGFGIMALLLYIQGLALLFLSKYG